MKKKLFAIILCLAMMISLAASLSEVSFAEGKNEEAVVLNEEETNDIAEEKIPKALGAPGTFDLDTINTIAKDNAGNYYGVKTYGNSYDYLSEKKFYKLSREQYDEVAKNCFMIYKEENGNAFELPTAKIVDSNIADAADGEIKDAGKVFVELQFRHHMAYRLGLLSNTDPTKVSDQEDYIWSIELKKDWIIEKTEGYEDVDMDNIAYVYSNCVINGNGHKIIKNDTRGHYVLHLGSEGLQSSANKVKNVTVKNVTIDGSNKYDCIRLTENAVLNLEDVKIINGSGDYNTSGGITMYNGSILNMDFKSKISKCSSQYGGAIFPMSKVTLNIEGELSENTAVAGGAIAILYQDNTINIKNNAKFIKNTATSQGGAIYSNSSMTIDKSTFDSNGAGVYGGAIYQSKKSELNITGSTFTENGCGKQGGAIYINTSTDKNTQEKIGVKAKFEESKFIKNGSNGGGGAIYINWENPNETEVKNCEFQENSSQFGGGIYVNVRSKLKVEDSKFLKNEAAYGAGISSGTYKAWLDDKCKLTVNKSNFEENQALMGGGVYTAFPTEITNSTFSKNQALIAKNDDQTNPHSSGVGGAVEVMDNKTLIKASMFEDNWAYGSGGALGISGVERDDNKKITTIKPNIKVEISEGTKFIKNSCNLGQGGAIYTIPYLYDLGKQETAVDKDTLKAKAYKNLSTAADTIFENNVALSGFVDPPEKYADYTNLKFARNSFTDALPDKDLAKSLLNNYDVNYKNKKLSAFFDPNGGEFKDGANPKEIRVLSDNKDAQITLLDAPKLEGHKFIGWKCSMNIPEKILKNLPKEILEKLNEGKIYQAGVKFKLDADYIFIAQWDKADAPAPSTKVILTLDENYRNGKITNIEVEVGELIEPHLYIPRRRGYIFRGWSYDRKHLDEVKPEDRIYSDTILYAIWKKAEIEKKEEPEEIKGEEHKAYIFGYPNGTVRPNGNITRAEAAAMLARLLNIEAIGSAAKPNFKDTESSWYNKAINAIVARGIMKGYPDGRFRPNAPITRAEFTQMIWAIDNKPYGTAPFADVKGHWAERAIGSEYQAKRITGYPDGLFRPDANITRAEAAVILNKIFERNFDAMSLAKCKNALMLKRFIDLDETFWGYNDMVEATNTHEYIRRYKGMIEEDWLLIK